MKYPEFLSPFIISPSIPLRWYGAMYIVGIACSYLLFKWSLNRGDLVLLTRKDKNGNATEDGGIFDMLFYVALGTIIGARIGYFVLYSPQTFLSPWEILGFSFNAGGVQFSGFAGMSFHGGMLGLLVACVLFARKYKYKVYMITDNIALSMSVCLFFGRIGNFLNAELYGRITDAFFGMRFPSYDIAGGYESWLSMMPAIRPYTEPRHPSQLYEAFLEGLVLAAVMYFLSKNKKVLQGTRTWVWLLLYGIFRTLVEFVREISEWQVGIFTAGMLYSIPMIIVSTIMLIYIHKNAHN